MGRHPAVSHEMLGCRLRPCPADGTPQRSHGRIWRKLRPSGMPAPILAGVGMMSVATRCLSGRSQEVSDEFTARIRLWRMLTTGEYHTLSSLAQATYLSLQEVRHHLEHVIKQARSLKKVP
mmetsp:Transcript_24015/g.52250  ORF Transcript_24015/g.52250 Transcript_24015/m.52250 type:complete len:121 (-) Transcript_24015:5-367(-)